MSEAIDEELYKGLKDKVLSVDLLVDWARKARQQKEVDSLDVL